MRIYGSDTDLKSLYTESIKPYSNYHLLECFFKIMSFKSCFKSGKNLFIRGALAFMFSRFDLFRYVCHVIRIYYFVSHRHKFIFDFEVYREPMEFFKLFECGIKSLSPS